MRRVLLLLASPVRDEQRLALHRDVIFQPSFAVRHQVTLECDCRSALLDNRTVESSDRASAKAAHESAHLIIQRPVTPALGYIVPI